MLIGKQINKIRKSRKMTLIELSQLSGVQVATLSRIENEKMVGTLESHMCIAKALGIDITQLYKDQTPPLEPITVETQDSATEQFQHNERSSYEILTKKILNKKMMPILLRLEKDGETTIEQGHTGSEKFIYVLEGKIRISINSQSFILEKGHTLYFNASLQHQIRNSGEILARVLCISTPVQL